MNVTSVFLSSVLSLLISCNSEAIVGVVPTLAPSPGNNEFTVEKAQLGKMLYFDARISSTKTISCNSCHNVDSTNGKSTSGTDNLATSTGISGLKGDRNAPTVWNSGLRTALFWDGRASSLEDQAKGPLVNPVEMGMSNHAAVENVVNSILGYKGYFKKAFGHEKATIDDIANAIGAFERTLMTTNSKFDRFQNGDINALNTEEKRGWDKFQKFACIACHGAPTFTGQDFYIKFPAHEAKDFDYLYKFTKDPGRMKFTKQPKDRNVWRVPSLRNVAMTAPYFHNGSVDTLEQAVRVMGRAQLGKVFSDEDVQDIVAFLKSLTGEFPKVVPPNLPQ